MLFNSALNRVVFELIGPNRTLIVAVPKIIKAMPSLTLLLAAVYYDFRIGVQRFWPHWIGVASVVLSYVMVITDAMGRLLGWW